MRSVGFVVLSIAVSSQASGNAKLSTIPPPPPPRKANGSVTHQPKTAERCHAEDRPPPPPPPPKKFANWEGSSTDDTIVETARVEHQENPAASDESAHVEADADASIQTSGNTSSTSHVVTTDVATDLPEKQASVYIRDETPHIPSNPATEENQAAARANPLSGHQPFSHSTRSAPLSHTDSSMGYGYPRQSGQAVHIQESTPHRSNNHIREYQSSPDYHYQRPHQHFEHSTSNNFPTQRQPRVQRSNPPQSISSTPRKHPQQRADIGPKPSRRKPSTWKSLWNTIGRGLDGLADVEESVSGRAHQLYSNTIQRKKKPDMPPIEQIDWSRFHHPQVRNANAANKPQSHTTSQEIPTAAQNPPKTTGIQRTAVKTASSVSPTNPVARNQQRRVEWRDDRIAGRFHKPHVANGGASTSTLSATAGTSGEKPQPATERIPPQFRQSVVSQPSTDSQTQSPRRKFPDEDDEEETFLRRLSSAIPRFPRFPSIFGQGSSGELASAALEAWKTEDEDSVKRKRRRRFGFSQQKEESPKEPVPSASDQLAAPMEALSERIADQENSGLLRPGEVSRCIAIGRSKAFFDILFLAFLMAGIHQLSLVQEINSIRGPLWKILKVAFHRMEPIAVATIETWAPMALICAFLSTRTSLLIGLRKENDLKTEVESSAERQSQYGALFLRLTSGAMVDRDATRKMVEAVRREMEAKVGQARLRAFAYGIVTPIVAAAFAFLVPILRELTALGTQLIGFIMRRSTVQSSILAAAEASFNAMKTEIANALGAALDHPLEFAYKLSFIIAVLVVSLLPRTLVRSPQPGPNKAELDDDEDDEMYYKFTEHIHTYGSSGINRLNLAAAGLQNGLLDRWSSLSPSRRNSPLAPSGRKVLSLLCVSFAAVVFLAAPLSFFFLEQGLLQGPETLFVPRWGSMIDVACVILLTQYVVWESIVRSSNAASSQEKVQGFVGLLSDTIADVRTNQKRPPLSGDYHGAVSASAGLEVRDLWASHSSKRAWALKGATISCKNGEVLAIIGDDGSAKTRLLVAIVESIVTPYKASKSLQIARGSISISGMDVKKWERHHLMARLGIFLKDVNSLGSAARLLSGMSLEEILDPRPSAGVYDLETALGDKERNVLILALKVSGLYGSLLRRLPSKMDTIVTAAEDDLFGSPLRPKHHMLSPSEWSKLLFAKVIAHVLYNNDNPSTSTQQIQNSLVGSVLILDDFTSHLSEAEEVRILRDLRESGAATVFASNRWAIGRLADRIAVMKDGSVVETGTHTELLLRGPKNSLYAAKWQAMAGISGYH